MSLDAIEEEEIKRLEEKLTTRNKLLLKDNPIQFEFNSKLFPK